MSLCRNEPMTCSQYIYIFPLNLTKVFSASALMGYLALRFKETDDAY